MINYKLLHARPRILRAVLFLTLSCSVFFGLAPRLRAQPAATGTITGRVYNPATKEYVRNAEIRVQGTDRVTYTEDGGVYRLDDVAAGTVVVQVTFTEYETEHARIELAPGATVARDFELVPRGAKDETVVLSAFVVSTDREGNAKAIMEQRAALNAKTVLASDSFGHVTEGNVGEFIKYLPGVVIDNNEADARTPRLGGLDPKYAAVTLDGQTLASAQSATFGGDTRGFEMENFSIHSIETVEVIKTNTADMDASAPAGTINLRSKNAFDLKGRRIDYELNGVANSYDLTLHKTPGPDNRGHLKIRPGFIFSAADSFLNNRFGLQVTLNQANVFTEQNREQVGYDFGDLARGPVVTSITWRAGPKITQRSGAGLNLDGRLTPNLIVSFRSAYSFLNDEFINRLFSLNVNRADVDPASTVSNVIARPTTNANTRLDTGEVQRHKLSETVSASPRFEYRHDTLTVSGGGAYSRAFTHYEDIADGFFSQTPYRLTRIGWTATRSAGNQAAWNVAQTSGLPWNDPASFNRADVATNTVRSTAKDGVNEKYALNLDVKRTFDLRVPVVVKVGGKFQDDAHSLKDPGNQQYTYVGPTGVATAPEAVYPVDRVYPWNPHKGGNMAQQGWLYPDRAALYSIFAAHPEYFTPDTIGNFTRFLQRARDVDEKIDAAYAEANTNWRRLRLDGGVRYEGTETAARTLDQIPDAVIRRDRPDLVANTIPYILYKNHNGERTTRKGKYDNVFLTGSAKYRVNSNFDTQVAFSQTIERPNLDNLAGITSINETTLVVTVPNAELKPERSNKYYAGVQYYIEPGGVLSIGGYVLDVTNQLEGRDTVTREEAGFGDDPAYVGYSFLQYRNAPDAHRWKGLEVEYKQDFRFLPKPFDGLSAFITYTRVHADEVVLRHVPIAATAGIGYSARKINVRLNGTWQSARVFDTATRYQKDRMQLDASVDYRFTDRFSAYLASRNILNEPFIYFEREPGLLRQHDQYGIQWTFGIKGRL